MQPLIVKPYVWPMVVFNKKEGLMTNQKLRQAWQAALDIEPIMKSVAGGRAEFYRLDSSLVPQEIQEWHTKIPGLPWNEHNQAKAKRLLQEAGYKGEPIRFMTTQEYKYMYDFALVSKQQLEDVGFNIDLQVLDWATVVKRRANPKEYDAFTSSIGPFYEPDAGPVPELRVAGLDLRRGHPARADAAGPGDGPEGALRALGPADQAVLREGARSSGTATSSGSAGIRK